jgi:hypothetical protein
MATATGKYRIRLRVMPCVYLTQGANGAKDPTWPDPGAGMNEWFAARDALNSGETIQQGIAQSTGFMKLRIKGRSIAIAAIDRVKMVVSGEVFNVTSVAREFADTVITIERAAQQTTAQ